MSITLPPASTPPSGDEIKQEIGNSSKAETSPLKKYFQPEFSRLAQGFLNRATESKENEPKAVNLAKKNFLERGVDWIAVKLFNVAVAPPTAPRFFLSKGYENLADSLICFDFLKLQLENISSTGKKDVSTGIGKFAEAVADIKKQHPAVTLDPSKRITPEAMKENMQTSYDNLVLLEYEARECEETMRTNIFIMRGEVKEAQQRLTEAFDPVKLNDRFPKKSEEKNAVNYVNQMTTNLMEKEENLTQLLADQPLIEKMRVSISKLRQGMGKELPVQFTTSPAEYSIFRNSLMGIGHTEAKLKDLSEGNPSVEDGNTRIVKNGDEIATIGAYNESQANAPQSQLTIVAKALFTNPYYADRFTTYQDLNTQMVLINKGIITLEAQLKGASPSGIKELSHKMLDLLKMRQKVLTNAIKDLDREIQNPQNEVEKPFLLLAKEQLNRMWTENDFVNELYEANVQQFDNKEILPRR